LHATRAAVEEGIVPGGGVALIRVRNAIVNLKGSNADQDAGVKIVLRALEEPLRQIVSNAGEEASVVVAKVSQGSGNFGYNAQTGEYGDLVESGVLDPTKVTRTALQCTKHRRMPRRQRLQAVRVPAARASISRRLCLHAADSAVFKDEHARLVRACSHRFAPNRL
jgi:hypothetical protein